MNRSVSAVLGGVIASWAVPALVSCASAIAARPDGLAPSPSMLATLRHSLAAERQIRLVGSFGTREITHPILDSAGVGSADWRSRSAGRSALFLTADAPPVAMPHRIAWSEISELQIGHTMTGRGALFGALGGAVVATLGVIMLLNSSAESTRDQAATLVIGLPVLILAGTFTGAAIGRSHGDWRTVYSPAAGEGQ